MSKVGKVVFALPTGRLLEPSIEILGKAGVDVADLINRGRRLIIDGSVYRFVLCKPWDVPVYVENGVADFGIVGNDVLWEVRQDTIEMLDLGIGKCKMVLASNRNIEAKWGMKIATKYPNITRDFFAMKQIDVDVIRLNGSVEVAPLVGLSDAIVDITSTGTTLRENGLIVIEEVATVSARLIVNRFRYKTLYERLSKVIKMIERVL